MFRHPHDVDVYLRDDLEMGERVAAALAVRYPAEHRLLSRRNWRMTLSSWGPGRRVV